MTALVALATFAGGLLATGCGGDDEDARPQVVRDVKALARAAALGPARRGDRLCDLLTDGSRNRLVGLAAVATEDSPSRGCRAAVAYVAWRIRPITAGRDVPVDSWKIDVDGDRATVRRGDDGDLRLVRSDGHWRADLEADPIWVHRVAISDACTRAGRTLALQPLAQPTPSGVRRYLDRRARTVEILAKRIARERPPSALAAGDRRLLRATRRAATHLRDAAQRSVSDASAAKAVELRRGDEIPFAEFERFQLRADVLDIGVGQLGVLCDGDFGDGDGGDGGGGGRGDGGDGPAGSLA